jgi:hypothetical protein
MKKYKKPFKLRVKNAIFDIKRFLGYIIFLPLWRAIYNKNLIKKYPFLEFKNMHYDWDDMADRKKEPFLKRYSSTWHDCLNRGWKKKFGMDLWRDLLEAIKKDGIDPDSVAILQVKEKYGTLRVYLNTETDAMSDVLSYYEDMSMLYCIHCGRPTKYMTHGWILYICDKCGKEGAEYHELLTTEHIPYREIWQGADKKPIRIDSKVPFEKYWPAPKEK